MKSRSWSGISTILLMASVAPRTTTAQAAPDMSSLQPLAFLAGCCWKGTFPGRSITDEHCFRWQYDRHFLRDHHVVRGDSVPYEGETTYAWDAQQRQIVYWYIALPGFYSEGRVDTAGASIVFHDRLVAGPDKRELRSIWQRTGQDTYTVRNLEVSGGRQHELWSMEMRRSRAAD